jgi:hypothetical protein
MRSGGFGEANNFTQTLKPVPRGGADGRSGEPIEEASLAQGGEVPTMIDQGQERYPASKPMRTEKWLGFIRR